MSDPDERVARGQVVQARVLEPVTRLGLFNTWREIDEDSNRALAELRTMGADWQWRRPGPEAPWLVRSAPGGR